MDVFSPSSPHIMVWFGLGHHDSQDHLVFTSWHMNWTLAEYSMMKTIISTYYWCLHALWHLEGLHFIYVESRFYCYCREKWKVAGAVRSSPCLLNRIWGGSNCVQHWCISDFPARKSTTSLRLANESSLRIFRVAKWKSSMTNPCVKTRDPGRALNSIQIKVHRTSVTQDVTRGRCTCHES